MKSEIMCTCHHEDKLHSYDPESLDANLACDIYECDCKDFEEGK